MHLEYPRLMTPEEETGVMHKLLLVQQLSTKCGERTW